MDLTGLIQHHARYRPGARAVVFGDTALDWMAFDRRVNRLAWALQNAGVMPGERVATALGNSLELLEIYWACARLGAVAVPLSPLLMESGLSVLLNDAAPKIVFANAAAAGPVAVACATLPGKVTGVSVGATAAGLLAWDEFLGASDAPPLRAAVAPDAIYNIMYTSGTTGTPKGIVLTHRIRALYGTLLANAWRMTADSVVLHSGAIVFNGAFVTLMPAFAMGATYVLHAAFDAADFIETVAKERVTHTMLVPSQIVAILNSPAFSVAKLESLQVLVSLGAPLALAHKEKLEQLLPRRLHELYGLTEGFVTILDRSDAVRKQGSVGVPPPFFELRILRADGADAASGEIGEIVGRGPLLTPGYYQRPDLTTAAIRDGWLHTGDLGRVDTDGYLTLVDRIKDMIDSGGVKIYPRDVEEVIVRHPDVAEAVVFGIPDDKWGETPAAAVQLKVGAGTTADALREWTNQRVAARYQRLARLDIVAEFPRNAAGKILKRALREPYWVGRPTRV